MPLPLFYNFRRALTLRLHSVNIMHCPRLPAYIKDKYPMTHLPPLWWRTSVLADPTLSCPPLQWHCCRLQLCLCSDDEQHWREALVSQRLAIPPPAPSVSSACALISPIWAYVIAAWSTDGRTPNDYVTSPLLP